MFRLTWRHKGSSSPTTCVGMRSTKTGQLRGLTQQEVDDFTKKFEGKDKLEEPIITHPFVPEIDPGVKILPDAS